TVRVIQFSGRQIAGTIPAGDQHLLARQQSRCMQEASIAEIRTGAERAEDRVVQFGRRKKKRSVVSSSRDEYLAVLQHRRRVVVACGRQTSGGAERSIRWIVKLGRR